MDKSSERKLITALSNRKLTLSCAESSTGGALSNRLTNIPGSSEVFVLGVIAYSNKAKCKVLKIPQALIKNKGAVSFSVAALMSKNIRKIANTDFGIGITGIAGPGGATKTKPVGTVYISLTSQNQTKTKKFNFPGKRLAIKQKSANKAIEMLLESIK